LRPIASKENSTPPRALDYCEPDTARAPYRNRRSRRDLRRVDRGTHSSDDAASDERRAIEREAILDFHQRVLMHQHLLCV
jgi:hypothetical protein